MENGRRRGALEILKSLSDDRTVREKLSSQNYEKRKAARDLEIGDILNRARVAVAQAESQKTPSAVLKDKPSITTDTILARPTAAQLPTTDKKQLEVVDQSEVLVKEFNKLKTNMLSIVEKFLLLNGMIKDIKDTLKEKSDDSIKVSKLISIVNAEGNAFKLEEAASERKPSISSAIGDVATATEKAVPGVAAFALALPFLFSPEVRDMIFGFFKGFLNGLGLSDTALSIAKPVLGAVIGILGAMFTMNALSPVVTLFEHMMKLVNLVSLAAQAVMIKSEMADNKLSELRSKRLKTLKRLKNLKRVKTFLMNASKLLKASFVAAAAGVAIDVVGGTLIDVVTADPDTEISPVNVMKMAINNLVESVTFGKVKGPFELDQKDPDELQDEIDDKKSENIPKSTSSASGTVPPSAEVIKKDTPTAITPAATTSAPPSDTAASPQAPKQATDVSPPAQSASIEPKNGAMIAGLSEEVAAAETDNKLEMGNSVIVFNNNNTIIAQEEDKSNGPVAYVYSADVGR